MIWELRSYLSCAAFLEAAFGGQPPVLKFNVMVYNYAAIPPGVLAETVDEAARIYSHGGIEIAWIDCPLSASEAGHFPACHVLPGPTTLVLRIVPQHMAELLPNVSESLGFAQQPDAGSFAVYAVVFPHDAEQLATRRGMPLGILLGHVVAHELGHLILGVGSHSTRGIMHTPWHVKELELMAQGHMTFTGWEVEQLRANLRARETRGGEAKQR